MKVVAGLTTEGLLEYTSWFGGVLGSDGFYPRRLKNSAGDTPWTRLKTREKWKGSSPGCSATSRTIILPPSSKAAAWRMRQRSGAW